MRSDDGVGLEVIRELRSALSSVPAPGVKVHPVSPMPERTISRLASEGGRMLIFDAVEAAKEPGDIVFCKLADTKYGFFATHNIPFRIVPGLAAMENDVYILGVQPESLEVGEHLSEPVCASVERIVTEFADLVEEGH